MTSARGRADEVLAQLREDAWEAGFAKELDALEHRSPTRADSKGLEPDPGLT